MLQTECWSPTGQGSGSPRSRSAQGLTSFFSSPTLTIPLPPRLWMTDASSVSSDEESETMEAQPELEKPRLRSRFRSHKQHKLPSAAPIGIFWDIENCQVPRGCSAIDVVTAIRNEFLVGRREAEFVVVCDVRKESPGRLQELNDAQVNLIHVCGTQKNAADDKLRQCMRRFGELHAAPAALLLISGDINFAADLSDFRHRKNMEVILVHKQNTSSALITCASSHYCYNKLTAHLPRNQKSSSQSEPEPEESHTCEIEVDNLPLGQTSERVSRRLRRLGDNCGGRVLRVTPPTAVLRFPTPDHAARALKRMDGEDVFGKKISTRSVRAPQHVPPPPPPAYSSDEGYGTAAFAPPAHPQRDPSPALPAGGGAGGGGYVRGAGAALVGATDWSAALQQLPHAALPTPFLCPQRPGPQPRQIRGTHGLKLEQSGAGDELQARAVSPWNSSASFSEQSSEGEPGDVTAELSVANLPSCEPHQLHEMLLRLFSEYVSVVKVSVRCAADGPIASVTLQSECDARIAISRLHRRRLDGKDWAGRRLELSLGRSSPTPGVEVVKARLRRLLLEQPERRLPLLRLRDVYAGRHACALTSSDLARVRDTVIVHEGYGRMVELVSAAPAPAALPEEEAPWRCRVHGAGGGGGGGYEDGAGALLPVYIEMAALTNNVHVLLDTHSGVLPLLSFMECYEARFSPLAAEPTRGVALELLLRSVPGVVLREQPSRHLAWAALDRNNTPSPTGEGSERGEARVAPALAPLRTLLERELLDLLKTEPRCSIPFSRFIPAYHRHFSRQLRVADYGFTKLPELLAVLHSTVVVLGSGSSRIITLSYAAQSRRWTNDLVKLLKNHTSRFLHLMDLPQLYHKMFGSKFIPADYGACTLSELMSRVPSQAVVTCPDGTITLPRREPTPEELARTHNFSGETIELLCLTPNLRMKFSQFVPAYHAHFSRQCRVSYYGCTKLAELFELIPHVVTIRVDATGERLVCLSTRPARAVMVDRLKGLSSVPLHLFAKMYNQRFGAPPQPDVLDADCLEGLILAAGGYVGDGVLLAPGDAPYWTNQMLTACAVLSSDRSVAARGSSGEFFVEGFKERTGCPPPMDKLVCAGVLRCEEERVIVVAEWRAAWRAAVVLASQPAPVDVRTLYDAYYERYEMYLPYAELGFESSTSFLRNFRELFRELGDGRFSLCCGVTLPAAGDRPRHASHDFSLFDTPPGQKGSRVFETPPATSIWSPPACALPAPSALLAHDHPRRVRLAAQFGTAIPTDQ